MASQNLFKNLQDESQKEVFIESFFVCAVIPSVWQIFNEHILCAKHSSWCWEHNDEQNSVRRKQRRCCMSDGEKCWGGKNQSKEKSLGPGKGASLDIFE